MPTDPTLNRLLTVLDVAPHAFSVCRIQSGWRMSFPVFKMIPVHFVLRGSGHIQAGGAAPLSFAPSSVLAVPALQPHWVGDADQSAATSAAADFMAWLSLVFSHLRARPPQLDARAS